MSRKYLWINKTAIYDFYTWKKNHYEITDANILYNDDDGVFIVFFSVGKRPETIKFLFIIMFLNAHWQMTKTEPGFIHYMLYCLYDDEVFFIYFIFHYIPCPISNNHLRFIAEKPNA